MSDILFKGSLDNCWKWAKENNADRSQLKFTPTGGAEWDDNNDEWVGGGKDELDENGNALFVVTKKKEVVQG